MRSYSRKDVLAGGGSCHNSTPNSTGYGIRRTLPRDPRLSQRFHLVRIRRVPDPVPMRRGAGPSRMALVEKTRLAGVRAFGPRKIRKVSESIFRPDYVVRLDSRRPTSPARRSPCTDGRYCRAVWFRGVPAPIRQSRRFSTSLFSPIIVHNKERNVALDDPDEPANPQRFRAGNSAKRNGIHHPADSPNVHAYHSACTRFIRRVPDPACAEPDPANSSWVQSPVLPG